MIRWSESSAVSSSDSTTLRFGIEDTMKYDHQEDSSCSAMTMMKFDKNRASNSLSGKGKGAGFSCLIIPPCSKVSMRSVSEETSKTNKTDGWSSSATLDVADHDNHHHDSIKQVVRSYYNNNYKKMVDKNNLANSKKFKKIDARKIRDPDDDIRYECQRFEVSSHNDKDEEDNDDNGQTIDDSSKRRRRLCAIFSRQKQSPMVMKLR